MSSPRQEPVIYEIFKETLEEYAAVWKGLSKRKKMLFLVADRFDKIHDLRRFILVPNRLDFTSVQGMNRWNAYTWNCIVDLVDKGFTNGEWQSFVNLDSIGPLNSPRLQLTWLSTEAEAVVKSWESTFVGEGHDFLWSYIRGYYERPDDTERYTNMCTIVQSSGTGKSRTVDELGKSHLLVYMNFSRSDRGYPLPDNELREFFLSFRGSSTDEAREGYARFFRELFKQTLFELKKLGDEHSKSSLLQWFHRKMTPNGDNIYRKAFFDKVLLAVDKYAAIIVGMEDPPSFPEENGEEVEQTTVPVKTIADTLRESAMELVNYIFAFGDPPAESQVPGLQVILAFDEAHVLCEDSRDGSSEKPFYVLLEVLQSINETGVWSFFISTSSKIAEPRFLDRALARTGNTHLRAVPPYTTLTYDTFAPRLAYMPDGTLTIHPVQPSSLPFLIKEKKGTKVGSTLTLDDASITGFLVRFGRPLFITMYQCGSELEQSEIVRYAIVKLVCNSATTIYDPELPVDVLLACLSQRLSLEFESTTIHDANEYDQITAHMRLYIKLDPRGKCFVSASSSEPILAEAAATVMITPNFKPVESLRRVLDNYSIVTGDRGRLVAMLAVTLACDAVVHEALKPREAVWHPLTSSFRVISVVDFMKRLFELDDTVLQAISSDFEDSYIYFNHFIRPFTSSVCNARYLLMYMTRGAAVDYSDTSLESDISFAIPVLHGREFRVSRLNAIVVQVKNGRDNTENRNMASFFNMMTESQRRNLEEANVKKGVIQILFSFASSEGLRYQSSTVSMNRRDVRAHQIWCGGICPQFLPGRKEDDSTWTELALKTMKWEGMLAQAEASCEGTRGALLSMFPETWVLGGIKNSDSE